MSVEENKALIRRLYQEVDKRNLAAMDEIFSPNFVDHNPVPIPGLAHGLEGVKQIFGMADTAFADVVHDLADMIAEGDKVVVRVTARGSFKNEFADIPPNGQQVAMEGIVVYRVTDGKIIEKWVEHDIRGLMVQMGVPLSAQE